MKKQTAGIHHITAIVGHPQENISTITPHEKQFRFTFSVLQSAHFTRHLYSPDWRFSGACRLRRIVRNWPKHHTGDAKR